MTVRQLRDNLEDTRELAGWMAFLELEPPATEHWHMTATLALNARRVAGDKRAKLKDFLPRPPRKVESAESMATKMKSLFPKQGLGSEDEDDDDEV